MGSETVPKIPVLELSDENLKAGSESWTLACKDVRKALEEYGCFELIYNKPSIEFHNSILESLDQVFQLPYQIKEKNTNPKPAHGYIGKNSGFPIHEGLGIEYATDELECQKFTNLMWPLGNQHFCESVHRYAKMVAELQEVLVKMVCESYGIEKDNTESHIKSTTYLLRLLKYRRSTEETNLGFKGHTDKSFLSILHQNHVEGLQLRTNDGVWMPYVPSSHSSFAVLAGDVCMAWSNDRIKSCYHRVVVEKEEVRYALGLFSFLKGWVKVPKELVTEENPLKYKPFEHQALLDSYLTSKDPSRGERNMVKVLFGI